MKYDYTPSFYSDEEFFNEYLGRTSYYLKLQNITQKLISFCKPNNVLEFGSALGTTISILAKKFPKIRFTGVDIRENVIGESKSKFKEINNLHFECNDMCDFLNQNQNDYDFVFLLYSFHHILDPISNKELFLRKLYSNLSAGSHVLITETFLPEDTDPWMDIETLFQVRALEGYASTYWESLRSLSPIDIDLAKKIAETSSKEESIAGKLVKSRDSEYLIKFEWLVDFCEKIGFQVIISEPVNCINEKAILLLR